MNAPLAKIALAVDGRLIPAGEGGVRANGISTDSRTTVPGNLFVPLRGPNFDGHDFIAAAASRGAVATLCEHPVSGLEIPQIVVSDTLKALGDLAAFWRRQFRLPVAAVTGSSGKTTTKEMLAAILSTRTQGLKTAGNFNNLVGLPLTVFALDEGAAWAVLEMGMSARGEIRRLSEIAAPTVGIVTNVAPAHLLSLKDIDGVARAKGELFATLQPGATAVVNADDPLVCGMPVANGVRKVHYGLSPQAEVTAADLERTDTGFRFDLVTPRGTRQAVIAVPGRHNVVNALAAAAAALEMGADLDAVCAGLAAFRAVAGRMEVVRLPRDITLLRDIYNANPLSVRAALITLAETPGAGERIAVLGDMLELGESSRTLHREVGAFAAGHCDRLLVVGTEAAEIAAGARDAGMAAERVRAFPSHAALLDDLLPRLATGDRILVKGSRGMQMERITGPLCASLPPATKEG